MTSMLAKRNEDWKSKRVYHVGLLALTQVFALTVLWPGLFSCPPAVAAVTEEAIRLNNDGVAYLKINKFQEAIAKFEEVLKLAPSYQLAQDNLAIAYNNFGMSLKNEPAQSVLMFRRALFWHPNNATALQNLEVTIAALGKNPHSFEDRVTLAKDARQRGELEGAAVELEAALGLKDDANVRYEFANILQEKHQLDRAIEQFKVLSKVDMKCPRSWNQSKVDS